MHQQSARYYTINQVTEISRVIHATIDRRHRDRADFPRRLLLGNNCAPFSVTDIAAWLERFEAQA
tara:strand:- start:662 stop:856 length:195 start_codon:yes stop_codon:yes gene_type:complete